MRLTRPTLQRTTQEAELAAPAQLGSAIHGRQWQPGRQVQRTSKSIKREQRSAHTRTRSSSGMSLFACEDAQGSAESTNGRIDG